MPDVKKVISQSVRAQLDGETVPAKERKPVEFGHKILLSEAEGTFITDYDVLLASPNDRNLAPWHRFRAGVEGTISVLKRAFRLFRCVYRGFNNFATNVGMGLLCHNLVALGRLRL